MNSTVQPVEEVKDPVENKSDDLSPNQTKLIVGGLIVGAILLIFLLFTQTIVQPILLIIGLLLGYTLFHARFGFTSAFRRFVSVGNGKAIRSRMLMLAAAVTFFAPLFAF